MTAAADPTDEGRSAPRQDSNPAGPTELLQAAHAQALRLGDQLQALAAEGRADRRSWLLACIEDLQHLAQCLAEGGDPSASAHDLARAPLVQRQAFGRRLRDQRNAAGLSRVQLARRAQVSDSTIKFLETARHPPSRATLLRLLAVQELGLTWAEVPGQPTPPAPERPRAAEPTPVGSSLNCYVSPTLDPVRCVLELGRFLNGSGGHVAQSSVYLEPQSAAAYLRCQQSADSVRLRASIPLSQVAQHITSASGPAGIQVIALGTGDATLEVRLVQHLLEGHGSCLELCLLDLSQPLLACALQRAADTLPPSPSLRVWGLAGDFHDLPLYRPWLDGPDGQPPRRRVYCLLGGTLADLDHEPRFFQHTLSGGACGDLLLLDVQVARGSASDPTEIKTRDPDWSAGLSSAQLAWLCGPIWRHGQEVIRVDVAWQLDTLCPLPGSYALEAVAKVQSRGRAERRFSMYRFRRYDPDSLAACLRGLGWEEIGVWPYGGAQRPASLRLFCKSAEAPGGTDAQP